MKYQTFKIFLTALIIILLVGAFAAPKKSNAVKLENLQEGYEDFSTAPITTSGKSFASYASTVLKFAIVLGGMLSVITIAVGGFEYILAGGNTGTVEKAKNRIWQAIIGLLVIVGSWLILSTINPDLVNLGLGITPVQVKVPAPSAGTSPTSCGYCEKYDSATNKCVHDDLCTDR